MINIAKINSENIVENIIVCDQYYVPLDNEIECNETTGIAVIGGTYNKSINKFISPKPYESWVLDSDGYTWKSLIEKPIDGFKYWWNEDDSVWVKVIPQS